MVMFCEVRLYFLEYKHHNPIHIVADFYVFGAQSSTPTQSARPRLLTAPSPSPSTAPTLEGSRSAAAP